ncbi:MAG: hypothetical protein ACE5KS_01365, partial [Woeseiaceae bacterium]
VTALILLFTAFGLAILGWVMSVYLAEELLFIALGVAPLLGLISIGFLVASYVVGRWYSEDDNSVGSQSKA